MSPKKQTITKKVQASHLAKSRPNATIDASDRSLHKLIIAIRHGFFRISPWVWTALILSAAIRLYLAWGCGIWGDEKYVRDQSLHSFAYIFKTVHWFHYLQVRVCVNLHDNEFFLRLPSFALGILSIWMAWEVGRLMFNRRCGIIFSLFMAFCPWFVMYSIDANYYSSMMFWTLAVIYCFALMQRSHKLTMLLPMSICMLCGFFTHPFMAVYYISLIPFLIFHLIFTGDYYCKHHWGRKYLSSWHHRQIALIVFIVVSIAFVFVLSHFSSNVKSVINLGEKFFTMIEYGERPDNVGEFRGYLKYVTQIFGSRQLEHANLKGLAWLNKYYCITSNILFFIYILGCAISFRRNLFYPAFLFLPFPIAFALLFNLNSTHGFSMRYYSFLAPIYWLAISAGISETRQWLANIQQCKWRTAANRLFIAVSATVCLFLIFPTGMFLSQDTRQWNKIMPAVQKDLHAPATLVFTGWDEGVMTSYYRRKFHDQKYHSTFKVLKSQLPREILTRQLKEWCYESETLDLIAQAGAEKSKMAVAWAKTVMEKTADAPSFRASRHNLASYRWTNGGRYILPPKIYFRSLGGDAAKASDNYYFDCSMPYVLRFEGIGGDDGFTTDSLKASLKASLDDAPLDFVSATRNDIPGFEVLCQLDEGYHQLDFQTTLSVTPDARLIWAPTYKDGRILITIDQSDKIYPNTAFTDYMYDENDQPYIQSTLKTFWQCDFDTFEKRVVEIGVIGKNDKPEKIIMEISVDGKSCGMVMFHKKDNSWEERAFSMELDEGRHTITVQTLNDYLVKNKPDDETIEACFRGVFIDQNPTPPYRNERFYIPPPTYPRTIDLVNDQGHLAPGWEIQPDDDMKTVKCFLPENSPEYVECVFDADIEQMFLLGPAVPIGRDKLIYCSADLSTGSQAHWINFTVVTYDANGEMLKNYPANFSGLTGANKWTRLVAFRPSKPEEIYYRPAIWVYPYGKGGYKGLSNPRASIRSVKIEGP